MTQLDLLSQVSLALQRARQDQQAFLPAPAKTVDFEGVIGSTPECARSWRPSARPPRPRLRS